MQHDQMLGFIAPLLGSLRLAHAVTSEAKKNYDFSDKGHLLLLECG
jgi:hypothetical protein